MRHLFHCTAYYAVLLKYIYIFNYINIVFMYQPSPFLFVKKRTPLSAPYKNPHGSWQAGILYAAPLKCILGDGNY